MSIFRPRWTSVVKAYVKTYPDKVANSFLCALLVFVLIGGFYLFSVGSGNAPTTKNMSAIVLAREIHSHAKNPQTVDIWIVQPVGWLEPVFADGRGYSKHFAVGLKVCLAQVKTDAIVADINRYYVKARGACDA